MQRLLAEFAAVANLISVDYLREEVVEAAFIQGTTPTEYCPDSRDQQLEKFH